MTRHPSWQHIKANYPEFAQKLQDEYQRRNGFVPYEQGCVYVIHAVGSNFYKIGKSINPDRRLLQIAPQMPFPTRFLRVWQSNFMSIAESQLHDLFRNQRANGEWFNLDSPEALSMLLDELAAPAVRHAYANQIKRILYQCTTEHTRFLMEFGSTFAADARGSQAIGLIEQIFEDIASEQRPPLPDEIAQAIDRSL